MTAENVAASETTHEPLDGAAAGKARGGNSIERRAAPEGRESQAFPVLSPDSLDRVKRFGDEETLDDGTTVFKRGQTHADFLVILEGCIEIFDYDCQGEPQVFTRHCDGQFTGEIDLFSDRKVLVGGRTSGRTRVIRIDRSRFRDLLAAEPDIGDIIVRAFIVRRLGILQSNLGGSLLIGRHDDPDTLNIRQFLRRNGYPVQTLYVEDGGHAEMAMQKEGVIEDDLPAFLCHGESTLRRPSILEVARCAGLIEQPDSDRCYDVAIIGGGPGGMAAAVYAASEGLSTVVLERNAPGGQAGTSSKIENYLGFPTGLSGQELAGRAQIQAQKFGATLALPMSVVAVHNDAPPYRLQLDGNDCVHAKSIVIASGARYRKLNLDDEAKYEGLGIYYAATALEASLCDGEEVIVVGGGNSAGQAAVFLSKQTRHVHMLIRGDSLADSMSDYLVKRIEASDTITLHKHTEITDLHGDRRLEAVTWTNNQTDESERRDIGHVFLMIGAVPNTDWLDGCVATDDKGFVCTGLEVVDDDRWTADRQPNPFECSRPNIFAVGDVRSGSVKRVASAVGEGSVCVQFVHRVVADVEGIRRKA